MHTCFAGLLGLAGVIFTGVAAEAVGAPAVYLGTGGTSTVCTVRTAPCGNLATAVAAVDNGGEIICLDAGPFLGSVGTTKAFHVNCPGTNFRLTGLELAPANGVVKFTGATLTNVTASAVVLVTGGHVILENCTVRNGSGVGVEIASEAGPAHATLVNSVVTSNLAGNILVGSYEANPASVFLDRVTMANSVYGLKAQSNGSATTSVEAHASVAVSHSNNGFIAVSNAGQGPVRFKITKSAAYKNPAYGAVATGTQAFMIVSDSSLTENGTGLAQLSGATVATYANNDVNFNTANVVGTITTIARR